MATTSLIVSASDSKPQTEAQGAGIEVQARLPGQPVFDSDDAPVGSGDAAAGLADAQVQPSVFVDSAGPTPSDAEEAEKRMLDAIGGALEQGPRAVVDAMWVALPKGKAYDKIYHYKSEFEELPISAACAMDQSLAVTSKLMEAFPDHVRTKDKFGRLSFHVAAEKNSNVAVILELLKAYPEAVRQKDDYGSLPLHVAACNNSNVAVILELLKAYPEAVREKNRDGKLPLHVAAEKNSDVAVILELLKAYPEAAREKDKLYGKLPLHLAACNNSNVAVILELLKAYPEAAREKEKGGRLPLHDVARNTSNVAVILGLLNAYPEAVREKDEHGWLPLHLAAMNISNVAVISELLKAYPEAVREKDKDENLPLHLAAWSNSNVAVILKLLKVYPDALLASYFQTKNNCLSALSQAGVLPYSFIKCMHPLYVCIRLSAELMAFSRSQRSKEIRLANGADEKAAELEQLACAIARGCKDSSSFRQEMDDCLQLAADLKLKFFISEPACSRRIEKLWWADENDHIADMLIFGGFWWLSGLNFVFNIQQAVPPPLVRFLMNRASYFAFLVCLLQLPLLAGPGHPVNNSSLEIFLAYWLFDICFSEAAEFQDIMKKHRLTAFDSVAKYAEDPWNVYDVVALSTAVAAAFVRCFVYAGVGNATAAASNQLYAWALALLWGRLVNVLSAVSLVGPLLIMVLTMVFKDLTKFAFLVALMELPFVAALYFLESGDGGNEAFATFPDSALSFFKIVIGQGPDISSVTASSSVLLSVGSVLLSVLLLNLLIAMFSKTFDTIVENSTQEYLLQKAQLTFTWARAPRMPPPLACALVLRDWVMNMVARHVGIENSRAWCSFWEYDGALNAQRVEPPPPTFDKKHFYEIVFSKTIHVWEAKPEHGAQWMQECDAEYETWCEQVLTDLEENAEFNSESQMDKFKSRMLCGMETTVESSGKIDQIAKNAKATQEQVKALSDMVQSHATQEQVKDTQEQVKALTDAVQSQHAQIQQIHASVQLVLQKLKP
jgi:ankyrin repeat protein